MGSWFPDILWGLSQIVIAVSEVERRDVFERVSSHLLMQGFRNAHPVMAPLENPQLPDAAAKAEASVKKFAKRLDQYLDGKDWLAADRFSIADITLFLTCGFCGVMQWKPHRDYEHISRHFGAVKERLS